MGDVKIGDEIVTPDNNTANVIAIHPQGLQDIYEIEFIDGAKIKTTKEHLFECWTASKKNTRKIRTIDEILKIKQNVIIPLANKLDFGDNYKEIDSYLIGALLGDGGLTKNNITFTTADKEILNYLNVEDNKIIQKKKYQFSIVSNKHNKQGYPVNQLLNKLKKLKLIPIKCEDRFIPNVIKYGSLHNRLEVLKGLMDTDGHIDNRGHCSFTSKSKQLALDVQYLVRSIGGKGTLSKKLKYCYYKGDKKECICYEVYIQTKNNKDLFKLKRKLARVKSYNGGYSELGRRIKSIKLIGREQAQCITISDKKGLYISDDFIVTHNSWLGSEWLLTNCYFYPNSKWFIGRKELKRLMASAYVTFQKVCKYHKIPENDWKLNGQYNFIEFQNGSRIDLLDLNYQPSDPEFERFGSLEYTGGWIEEAGEVVFKAFDVLKSRIGRQLNKELDIKSKLLLTANPKKNWLKRTIWKPWRDGILPNNYAYIQSLYSDNHYTSKEYGENLSEIKDKVTRERLKEGNWNYDDSANSLVDIDAIQDLWTNTVETGNKYLVIDVARFGQDTTKFYYWNGWKVYKIETFEHQNTEITASKAKEALSEEQIPFSRCLVDEVGVGGGVLDNLKGAKGFIANSIPMEDLKAEPIYLVKNGENIKKFPRENFKTLKDQCGYKLAEKINRHEIGIDCNDEALKEIIEEEVSELKDYKPDEDTKKQLVPKDEIKENIGRSPDNLDCLLMRMFFELDADDGEDSDGGFGGDKPNFG